MSNVVAYAPDPGQTFANPIPNYAPPAVAVLGVWDTVTIAGTSIPLLAQIRGFARVWRWDSKQGKGADGSTETYVGTKPAEGEITFTLYQGTDFTVWAGVRPLFDYVNSITSPPPFFSETVSGLQVVQVSNTTKAFAFDISHPALTPLGIRACIALECGPVMHEGANLYTVTVKLREWRPPPQKAAVATPKGASSTPGGGSGSANPSAPAPTDPLQIKIQQMQATLNASIAALHST